MAAHGLHDEKKKFMKNDRFLYTPAHIIIYSLVIKSVSVPRASSYNVYINIIISFYYYLTCLNFITAYCLGNRVLEI